MPFDFLYYNKDSKTYKDNPLSNLLDGKSTYQAKWLHLDGYTGDHLLGFRVSFEPTISGGFYSQHTIDFSNFKFYIDLPGSVNKFYLSPTAVPVVCYARYYGSYDYQIYDGSSGYDRWIYDNDFVLNKPISFSYVNPKWLSTSGLGGQFSISSPSISSADLLDVTAYRNEILGATQIVDKSLEDYSYQNIRISLDNVQCYIMFDINENNFISLDSSYDFPSSLDGYYINYVLEPSPDCGNLTSVNVKSVDYLNDTNDSLLFISNGFRSIMDNFSTGLSNVVTNATDNANRIIQNTTQKVDEVKQGVTEVKDSVIETKNSILDLPNKIKEMLTGFFVPDEETINSKFAEFETLLSDRFGLIYQSADIIHDFADSLQTQAVMVADTGGIITLPSVTVSLAGVDYTFGGYDVDIIPNGFEALQTAVRLATSMVCTVVFVNMLKNKLEAILK